MPISRRIDLERAVVKIGAIARAWIRGCVPTFICVVALGLIQCDQPQEPVVGESDPRHSSAVTHSDFDADGVAYLGYMEPFSAREVLYVLNAPAGAELSDIRIECDCPCVKGLEVPRVVAPDASVPVRIWFEAPDKRMAYRQDFAIHARAGGKKVETWLSIDARVGLPIRVMPDTHHCLAGTGSHLQVELQNEGMVPVSLIYASSDNPLARVQLSKTHLEPGQVSLLDIKISEGWSTSTPTFVRVKTTCRYQPEVTISVYPK